MNKKRRRKPEKPRQKAARVVIPPIDADSLISPEEVRGFARSTGFIKRAGGKIDPVDFFLSMVFRNIASVPVGLGLLTTFLNCLVSRPALHQKFNKSTSRFFRACLGAIILKRINNAIPLDTGLLRNFTGILLVDSSSWDVPETLAWIFPGSGGSASKANCKLQFCYDYKSGYFYELKDKAGSQPDQKYSPSIARHVKAGALAIFDLGYWAFETFHAIADRTGYFLSRMNTQAGIWSRDGGEFSQLDLSAILAAHVGLALEMNVCLRKGDRHVDVRLVAWRVPEEVANTRRMRLRKDAARKGRTPTDRSMRLCDWCVFVTNAGADKLPAEMMRSLYRVRWNVELVFKSLKSVLRIHKTSVRQNQHRLRCELYAKMILAVIVHRIYSHAQNHLWQTMRRELSLDKLWKFIDSRKETIWEAAKGGHKKLARLINSLLHVIVATCEKLHQKSRKTTLQQIDEMLGDPTPVLVVPPLKKTGNDTGDER